MRIGMILDAVFPPDPRVENEAVSLVKAGHEVFLFCLKYADEKTSEIINGIKVKRYTSSQLEYKLSALAYTFPLYTFLMHNKATVYSDASDDRVPNDQRTSPEFQSKTMQRQS